MSAWDDYKRAQLLHYQCNLTKASMMYSTAGGAYWSESQKARVGSVSYNIGRWNAAICYFLAGLYAKSTKTLEDTNFSRLGEKKELAEMLHDECMKRLKSSYIFTVKGDLKDMREKKMHKSILELLRSDPYILDSENYARQMRDSCYALGMWEVAKAFEADMTRIMSSGIFKS